MYENPKKTNSIEDTYLTFLEYIKGYMDSSIPMISNLANFCAIVNDFFDDINWVGFYLLENNKLFLGPFQGKAACVEIELGKGVCGTSAKTRKSIIVPDTHAFEGHITCDPVSLSEVVIPILKNDILIGVLDIDSPLLNRFSNEDLKTLESAVNLLVDIL